MPTLTDSEPAVMKTSKSAALGSLKRQEPNTWQGIFTAEF